MKRIGLLLALGLVLGGPVRVPAQELAPRDIAARTRPAVVLVTALDGGTELGEGSGFLVSSDGTLVTNRHVIEGADALRVQLSTGEVYDQVYFISDDERRDLAILRIPATGLPRLAIANDEQVAVGDPVYVMGNPLGLEGTFSDGLVSGKRMVAGVELLQITAPISPGSSGGPVLNARGDAIGIATLMLTEGQNMNLAVPARYAQGLLAMGDEPRPFADVAGRLAANEQRGPGRTRGRTGGTIEDGNDDGELEIWQQVLLAEMESANRAAESLNMTATHEPFLDMIDAGETDRIEYTFDSGYRVVSGVCDVDCSDLDLSVHDRWGNLIEADIETDDRPVVGFEVSAPGTYEVRVYMVDCSREPCGYAVQAYAGEHR